MTALPNILLESQQSALLGLLAGLEVAAESLRPGLLHSFIEELARHVASLEIGVFPVAERLSLRTRVRLAGLRAEHARLLGEVGERLRSGPGELPGLRVDLVEHFDRERALLEPMLARLTWLHEAAGLEVDRWLSVTRWSAALERATGRPAEQQLGRPLPDLESVSAGNSPGLAVPNPTGASVWFPSWVDCPKIPAAGSLRTLLRDPYPESLPAALEGALEGLRRQLGAERAELCLVHPVEGGSAWRACQAGGNGVGGHELSVPLPGLEGPVGSLRLTWSGPEVTRETALTLLLWAAVPLTLAVEPLLDSLQFPGHTSLSPGLCARALGLRGQ